MAKKPVVGGELRVKICKKCEDRMLKELARNPNHILQMGICVACGCVFCDHYRSKRRFYCCDCA
jgi:hypothetical protein